MFSELHRQTCMEPGCVRGASVALQLFDNRQVTKWNTLCDEHARVYAVDESRRPYATAFSENRDGFTAVDVSLICCCEKGSLFMLRDKGGRLTIPICSGPAEGYLAMSRFHPPRKDVYNLQMHEAFVNVASLLGARLDSVVLADMTESNGDMVFKSFVSFVHKNKQVGLQLRATDALAVAFCGNLPVFVKEELISRIETVQQPMLPWILPGGNKGRGIEPDRAV